MVIAALSDVDLALIIAGATALGAGIGGGIAGLLTLRAEEKRQKFAEAREERGYQRDRAKRAVEARVAARLVFSELDQIYGRLHAAYTQTGWLDAFASELATHEFPAWRTHQTTLAAEIESDHPWYSLNHAYRMLEADKVGYAMYLQLNTPVPARTSDALRTLNAVYNAMMHLLEPADMPEDSLPMSLDGVPPPWKDLTEEVRKEAVRRAQRPATQQDPDE